MKPSFSSDSGSSSSSEFFSFVTSYNVGLFRENQLLNLDDFMRESDHESLESPTTPKMHFAKHFEQDNSERREVKTEQESNEVTRVNLMSEFGYSMKPLMRKSVKYLVPDGEKDSNYWAKREKNNSAAKKSREAKRQKGNQIAMRAYYLEEENQKLKKAMGQLNQENEKLKHILRLP